MDQVLVTGASGMLGANLCRRLVQKGLSVRALARTPLQHPSLSGLSIEEISGDILDRHSLEAATRGCQGIFHAAGFISYRNLDRKKMLDIHSTGTRNVLEVGSRQGVQRTVLTSSTATVGVSTSDEPLDEQAPFLASYQRNPYMASKRQGEDFALNFPDMEVVSVNPSTIFGAGDVKGNTGHLFQRLQAGRLRWIPPGGTAMVSVEDCVDGHWAAWTRGKPRQRYILSTANYSYRELFTEIAAAMDVQPPRHCLPSWLFPPLQVVMALHDRLGEPLGISQHIVSIGFRNRFFSAQRARQELNWKPRQTLAKTLQQAVHFYRQTGLLKQ